MLGKDEVTRDQVQLTLWPNHIRLQIGGVPVLDSKLARKIIPEQCGFKICTPAAVVSHSPIFHFWLTYFCHDVAQPVAA